MKKGSKQRLSLEQYIQGLEMGDRIILGKAITLIESQRPSDIEIAETLVNACIQEHKDSYRIGISGAPGVGKSTFIDCFGEYLIEKGHKVAVLAVDPSSISGKGSILGDKTRMNRLSVNSNAFVRPSPSRGTLGGVTRKTRETIIICEKAGYDHILIETVGVGQSESQVHGMVDLFMLLTLPQGGDELQGIKKGIMELADMIIVNKADGALMEAAKRTRIDYKHAQHLFRPRNDHWQVPVHTCSALEGDGMQHILGTLRQFQLFMKEKGMWEENRKNQDLFWLEEALWEGLKTLFFNDPNMTEHWEQLKQEVREHYISPVLAAKKLLQSFTQSFNSSHTQ